MAKQLWELLACDRHRQFFDMGEAGVIFEQTGPRFPVRASGAR